MCSSASAAATWAQSVPIRETWQGTTVWEGDVEVFDLAGHPTAIPSSTPTGTLRGVSRLMSEASRPCALLIAQAYCWDEEQSPGALSDAAGAFAAPSERPTWSQGFMKQS